VVAVVMAVVTGGGERGMAVTAAFHNGNSITLTPSLS
jgi:hypothetical protein